MTPDSVARGTHRCCCTRLADAGRQRARAGQARGGRAGAAPRVRRGRAAGAARGRGAARGGRGPQRLRAGRRVGGRARGGGGLLPRRGVPTDAGQIVFAPGSKPLLFALLQLLPGDVVLPVPCWVSYAAHAAIAGKRVIGVPIGGGGRRRARPGAAARRAGRGGGRRRAPRRARAHAARQPDRHRRLRGGHPRGLRDRRRGGPADRLRRDLPRPRVRARALRQPRRAPARAHVRDHRPEQAPGARRLARRARAAGRRAARRAGRRRARRAGERDLVGARGADAARGRVRARRAAGGRRARRREPPPAPRGQPRRLRGRDRRGRECRPPSGAFYLYPDFTGRPFALRRASSPTTCSRSATSPCSPARRSATTPRRCASAWPRACSTARATSRSARRWRATTRWHCRGSPRRSTACAHGFAD